MFDALNQSLKYVPGLAAVHRTPLTGRRLASLSVMKKAVLDGNIYDLLAQDENFRVVVSKLVIAGSLCVVVTRTIAKELFESPFRGVPDFFQVEHIGNTIGRCGLLACGDSIGRGEVFDAHLGGSQKIEDALIADAADCCADWLVSEDKRLRSRMAKVGRHCCPLSYEEFVECVASLSNMADNQPLEPTR